jgi:myosin protein heavy chain/myosin heavy chain 6/7
MDEMANEAHISEDKAKKALVDAARLADELRGEQDIGQAYEKEQKLLECQIKDIQQHLDDAETNECP